MVFEGYNDTFCIACDWLQFSVILANPDDIDMRCPEGFRVEILQGNNIFAHRAIVYRVSDEEKWLTLLWSPYSRLLKRNLMTVQVANPLLYKDGIMTAFRVLQEVVDCTFNSMGRIDICVDYQMTPERWQIVKGLNENKYYVQGKAEGSSWWHADKTSRGSNVHCLSWGSVSSEIKVKTYNKSRELGLASDSQVDSNNVSRGTEGDKPYISARWKDAGFDISKVWRLEFSMKSSGLLEWQGQTISLSDVSNSKWLLDVWMSLYSRRFIIRKNMGGRSGHKNTDPRYYLLMLPVSDEMIRWKGSGKEPLPPNGSVTAVRKIVAMLDSDFARVSPDVFEPLGNALLSLCEKRGMRSYFSHAYGEDVQSWLESRWSECGEGMHDVVASPREL